MVKKYRQFSNSEIVLAAQVWLTGTQIKLPMPFKTHAKQVKIVPKKTAYK